jgi:hypothetical protein
MINELKDIKPGYGLGIIKFGMTRAEIISILGEADNIENYSYTDSDTELTEAWEYEELELSLNFDKDEDWRLVMISVTSDLYRLNGKKIIGLSHEKLLEQLNELKFSDLNLEDFSSEEIPDHKLIEVESKSINFWIEDGVVDEIQWSPFFIDDDTIGWPE